jgi:hypothetical protein
MIFNTGYIWFYKHRQFVDRADVTENLIRDAKLLTGENRNSQLRVSCFPLAPEIASIALGERLGLDESAIRVEPAKDSTCSKPRVDLIQD